MSDVVSVIDMGAAGQVVLAPGVRLTELGDELTVFNAASGLAYALNRTAAHLIALTRVPTTTGWLTEQMAAAYGMPHSEMGPVIDALVQELVHLGILVVTDASAA